MNKSTFFSGQPTFYQLIKLIPKGIVSNCVDQTGSDHYRKTFFTWDHLVAMLFTCYGHCQTLREVVTGMKALEGKLLNLGIRYFPAKSTLADANATRDSVVFEKIFFELKAYWDSNSPDSRTKNEPVYIVDSTTIKLFQEIFRGAGPSPANGKRKGGLKVHMAIEQSDEVPSIVHLTQAAYNDGSFTKYLNLPAESTVIMDRGYKNYDQFNAWTKQRVRWVTRIQPNAFYKIKSRRKVTDELKKEGIRTDWEIVMGAEPKKISKVRCRLIKYTSAETGKKFEFITNDFDSDPITIADLYKKRWKIELLFKRLKQNMPLRYFLGDNKNAIRIQIWCALIADLLVQVVKRQIKRKWAFSNIVSLIRLHLFNYLDLFAFLENPELAVIKIRPSDSQLKLNLSG